MREERSLSTSLTITSIWLEIYFNPYFCLSLIPFFTNVVAQRGSDEGLLMEWGRSLVDWVHCGWAEATSLIDAGAIAGMGKPVQAATAGQVPTGTGATEANGAAFWESLKASVGSGLVARGTLLGASPAAKPVSAAAAPGKQMAIASPVVFRTTPTATETSGAVAQGPAVHGKEPGDGMGSERGNVSVTAKAGTADGLVGAVAIEAAPQAKAVAGVAGLEDVPGRKTVKVEACAVATGKQAAAKSVEVVASTTTVPNEAASATAVNAPVPVVAVQATAIIVEPVTGGLDEERVKAGTGTVSANSKVAKAGAGGAPVKGSGRESKKLEGDVTAVPKTGAGAGSAAASPTAGNPDGVTAKASTVGFALPVGGGTAGLNAVAGHAGVAALGVAKVAAGAEAVTSPVVAGGAQGPEVKTLAATPNLLEVGIDGGTHGWLRVRAELGQTGEVTASMVATSAGQADTLRRELPAISTYLAGESVGVSSLVVNAMGAAAGAQDAAMSLGAGAQGGGADGRAQQGSLGAQGGEPGGGARGGTGGAAGLEFGGAELPAAVYANGSGSWLSVRV